MVRWSITSEKKEDATMIDVDVEQGAYLWVIAGGSIMPSLNDADL